MITVMNFKVLITGSNGMLGSSFCRLYEHTDEVYAIHRDKKSYVSCSADFSLDLTKRVQLQKIFFRIKPDLVIHCAGLANVDKCEKIPELAYDANVTVTENIAQICATETKLVYISSDQVYGEVEDHSESNLNLKPMNIYGKTKLKGEHQVQEHSKDHIIIRTNIFGWNIKPGKINSAEWIYNSLRNNQPILLFDDYIFSPVYTESLGKIIMQLVRMYFTGIVNVGSKEPCTKYEFGKYLSEVFEFDKSLITKGSIADHDFAAPRPNNLTLNSQKLVDLCIVVPDYKTSIKIFYKNRPLL